MSILICCSKYKFEGTFIANMSLTFLNQRLPQAGDHSTSLTELKKYLDNTLGHRVWLLGISCAGLGIGLQWFLWISSNSGYSIIKKKKILCLNILKRQQNTDGSCIVFCALPLRCLLLLLAFHHT